MSKNVAEELATLGNIFTNAGWVKTSGNTYRHPEAPRLRLNVAYTYAEATVSVSTWDGDSEHVSRVVLYYRGANPLAFMLEHGHSINAKIFPSSADNTPPAE